MYFVNSRLLTDHLPCFTALLKRVSDHAEAVGILGCCFGSTWFPPVELRFQATSSTTTIVEARWPLSGLQLIICGSETVTIGRQPNTCLWLERNSRELEIVRAKKHLYEGELGGIFCSG